MKSLPLAAGVTPAFLWEHRHAAVWLRRNMASPLVSLSDPLVEHAIEELVAESIRLIPNVVAAVVVFVVAAEVGRVLGDAVERGVGHTGTDGLIEDSPLDGVVPGGGVGAALGTAVRYYVILVGLVAAASTLGLSVLTGWLFEAATYAPALAGGLVLLVFGVVAVERATRPMGESRRTVRLVLYAAVVLVALETMGAGTGAVGSVAGLVVLGAVLSVAVAVGLGGAIAVGLGGREYAADAIENWGDGGDGADGGTDAGDEAATDSDGDAGDGPESA